MTQTHGEYIRIYIDVMQDSCHQYRTFYLSSTYTGFPHRISLVTILDKFGIPLHVGDVSHGTVDPEALRKVDGTSAEKAGSVDGRLLIINKKVTMKSLMAAVETMSNAFQPLEKSMEELVYFSSKKGRLFEKHLRSGLEAKESKSLQVKYCCPSCCTLHNTICNYKLLSNTFNLTHSLFIYNHKLHVVVNSDHFQGVICH